MTQRMLARVASLSVGLAIISSNISLAEGSVKPRFVIPGGLMPNSVDPLEVDQFSNYFPSQMIYLPPLEAALDGSLTSNLLSAFEHDEKNNLITLKLGNWTYSDGTKVSIADVALAIKRMILARPSFPVIRFVAGVTEWVKSQHPLTTMPKGMAIHGDTLTIKLTQKVYHPLFRLSLNIFSVIPSHCIDLKTSKLTCKVPPSSGYYLSGTRSNTQIEYRRRGDLPQGVADHLPPVVVFEYANKPPKELIAESGFDSVIWGYDLNFSPEQYHSLETDFRIERLPSAWFTGFVLNPRVKPFDNKECRRWFAHKFRSAFASQDLGVVRASGSIFTSLIPGYMTDEQLLANTSPISADVEGTCLEALRARDFVFAIRTQTTPPFVQHALDKLAKELGFKIAAPVVAPSSHCGWPSYDRDDVAMQLTNSGFWALDPVGDVQMLLAPNMHEDYMDISSDENVRALLKDISGSLTSETIAANMGKLNRYLYDQGLFNIFSNQSYFYISSKTRPKRQGAAFSVTLPYPWQVF